MQPPDPQYESRVRKIFADAAFMAELGVELVEVGPGWCESTLKTAPKHFQQDHVIHAAVQAAMADHTSGAAAGTLIRADQIVLTVEFKINLLRPARGERLRCRAEVLKPGKGLTVCESSVFTKASGKEVLTAKAMVTLAITAALAEA